MEFCADHRFHEDTLFIILEEDYRFWPKGEDPDGLDDYEERLAKVLAGRARGAVGRAPADVPAAETGAKGERAKGKSKGLRRAGDFHFTPQRGSTDQSCPNHGLKTEVADLIRIATMCHRKGCGDFIWFGWDPSATDRPTWLCKGSHGIMMSKRGAYRLGCAMNANHIERGHIDLVLKHYFCQPGNAAAMNACYIWPPIGSYYCHASGCDPKNFGADKGGRPAGWNLNPAKGTRKSQDVKERDKYVLQWQGTGGKKHKTDRKWMPFPTDEELHTTEYLWRTLPTVVEERVPTPPPNPNNPGENRGGEPNAPPAGSSDQVVLHPNIQWTDRAKRNHRAFNRMHRLREFVDDPDQARLLPTATIHATTQLSHPSTQYPSLVVHHPVRCDLRDPLPPRHTFLTLFVVLVTALSLHTPHPSIHGFSKSAHFWGERPAARSLDSRDWEPTAPS